jgi:hypothetical protein
MLPGRIATGVLKVVRDIDFLAWRELLL